MSFLVIITGASRGFGRALAVEVARYAAANAGIRLQMMLLARDESRLVDTKSAVHEIAPSTSVVLRSMDLAHVESMEGVLNDALKACDIPSIEKAVLFNNAGSLGAMMPIRDLTDVTELSTSITMNVTSTIWMSTLFLRSFHTFPAARSGAVVNISSLAAIKPFPSQLLYCTGKAARDMLTAGLAEEEGSKVRTLNYAPGPMDTDMQVAIRESSTLPPTVRDMFKKMHTEGKLVDVNASAAKCVKLVFEETYTSGAHIDFFDV